MVLRRRRLADDHIGNRASGRPTGFLGAYTTFSTYMFESDGLMRDGAQIKALLNLLGSVILGLVAVRLGWILGTR